jgi:hypothetical protein
MTSRARQIRLVSALAGLDLVAGVVFGALLGRI